MSNILNFIPKKELTAKNNLSSFINFTKEHLTLWSELKDFKWENNSWPTHSSKIRYIKHEDRALHSTCKIQEKHLMHPDFISLCKAYLRYRHSTKPHKNLGRELQALRLIEYVLRINMEKPDITQFDQSHFNTAMDESFKFKAYPYIAGEIINILKTLAEFNIVTDHAHYWKNPFIGKASYAVVNGAHASPQVKQSKLPDQDSLLAIAEVFSRGYTVKLDDVDIMITSITCLLLSAPIRISELLRLRVDCIGEDMDKDGKKQYYIKYWVSKIQSFDRKPITATMAPLALEAIKRLKEMTHKGRLLATYLESDESSFYRHENCPDVPENEELTSEQIRQALGFLSTASVSCYLKRHNKSYSLKGYSLHSLWEIILTEHRTCNPNFPYQELATRDSQKPLKMSESLFCFFRLQFSVSNKSSPIILAPFNKDYYSKRLEASFKKDRKNQRPLCFFTRHGFEPKKLKSHSLRHFLNNLAHQNGIPIETITQWSSRASDIQTLTYLNIDSRKSSDKAAVLLGVHAEQIHKSPITDDEAEILSQGPFHRSRYGLCRQSWRSGPCNKFADCLNCSQLIICKGDRLAKEVIEQDYKHLMSAYGAACAAVSSGERSASRWTLVTSKQIEKISQLLSILDNADIPDGSPIEIVGTDFNHEQTIIEQKTLETSVKVLNKEDLKIEYGSELLKCLDIIRNS